MEDVAGMGGDVVEVEVGEGPRIFVVFVGCDVRGCAELRGAVGGQCGGRMDW
jgi:hypothetical protein